MLSVDENYSLLTAHVLLPVLLYIVVQNIQEPKLSQLHRLNSIHRKNFHGGGYHLYRIVLLYRQFAEKIQGYIANQQMKVLSLNYMVSLPSWQIQYG